MNTVDVRQVVPPTIPHDLAAEQAVLGAMLWSADAISDVVDVVDSSDFYRPNHAAIFDVIVRLFAAGQPSDPVTVADALDKAGSLERVGGRAYLHTLSAATVSSLNGSHYAGIVAEKALLRRLWETSTRTAETAVGSVADARELLDRAQSDMFALTPTQDGQAQATTGQLLDATFAQIEAAASGEGPTGLPTGLTSVDDLTQGLHAGQLIVIAGRPSMGKSTLGLNIAAHTAAANKHVAFYSLEMPHVELMQRLLSAAARVPLPRIRNGHLSDQDWARLSSAMPGLDHDRLLIDDSSMATPMSIRAHCRRLAHQGKLDLIVIDYLQLMTTGRRSENRQQEVAEISRALKLLGKELAVPVIAISQLNRASEARADRRPMLSDLRESGAVEQDSDVVILVHRDEVYDPNTRPGEADLIIPKQRNGPIGVCPVTFNGAMCSFGNIG